MLDALVSVEPWKIRRGIWDLPSWVIGYVTIIFTLAGTGSKLGIKLTCAVKGDFIISYIVYI